MVSTQRVSVRSIDRCDDLLTVRFDKPDGYTFKAGQWLRLTLRAPQGPESRTLSHASAPSDEWLEVSTRVTQSAFKRALSAVRAGDEVEVSPPGGRLTLPEPPSSAILLVGGIGITPVRSLMRDALFRQQDLTGAVLLYGNKDESCLPYRDELADWQGVGLKVVQVLESPPEGWTGERGFITSETIRRAGPVNGRHFIVTGPPGMIAAMDSVLDELGVPESDRTVESFGPTVLASTPAPGEGTPEKGRNTNE